MKTFEIKIIRPTSEDTYNIEWIDIKTPTGNFLVGPEHYDLITKLKERDKLTYKKVTESEPESVNCYGGILKIENGKVIIILDL